MKLSVFVETHNFNDGEEPQHDVVAVCCPEDSDELLSELEVDAEDQSDEDCLVQVSSYEVPATLDDEEPEDWAVMYVVFEDADGACIPLHVFDDEEAALERAEELGSEESIECYVASSAFTPIGATE